MKGKIILAVCAGIAVLIFGIALGSVYIAPGTIFGIISHKLFGTAPRDGVAATTTAILWTMRLPRTLLAFTVGAALSVSGAVMQSVLRNPLASSYTLGVSSGASLGAGIVLLLGVTLPLPSSLTLPVMGFAFGLGTIVLAVAFAARIDGRLDSNTIILTGMVLSLFFTAIVTLMSAFEREHMQRLFFWQMGSFSGGDWKKLAILAPVTVVLTLIILHFNRELDIMTFGEEQAQTIGVSLKAVKWLLLISAAALTGSVIAFTGVIGFVDLVAPHVVRKLFGSRHRLVIPMSALFGGAFMVVCDLAARTAVSPSELPVGAVTALIGAPFFAYIYISRRKRASGS